MGETPAPDRRSEPGMCLCPGDDVIDLESNRYVPIAHSWPLEPQLEHSVGHGGVLDRIDALLFVVPAVYYLVRILKIG